MNITKKPTLCLHVGYGKTGSTAIQNWLVCQQQELKEAGVTYPIPQSGIGDSGNGLILLEALERPEQRPRWLGQFQGGIHAWLFSREQLARELAEPGRCQQLALWAKRWGFGSVQMLLFVRDPRDHCYSLWAQKVKRAGESRSLTAFAADYDAIMMAFEFTKQALEANFNVHVYDYGKHRDELMHTFAKWLEDIVPETQNMPTIVNNSRQKFGGINITPCRLQLEVQRQLNKISTAKKIAAIAGLLPNSPISSPPSHKFCPSVLDKWRSEVSSFNSLINKSALQAEDMPFE